MNQIQGANTYLLFKFPHLVGTHPTYWSYLLLIGNVILLGSIVQKKYIGGYFVFIAWLVFNGTLLLLSARTPLFINILLHVLIVLFYIRTRRKLPWVKITVATIILLIISTVLSTKMNLLALKFEEIPQDERFFLWAIALHQIQNNFYILGEGLGLGAIMLKEFILENGDPRINYNSFDLHNQYLRHYLDMGIIGVLALLYLIFHPLTKAGSLGSAQGFLLIGVTMVFGIACLTEAPLYRLMGIILFSVFYPVFLIFKKQFP